MPITRELVKSVTLLMCVGVQSCLTLCDPMDCSLPGSSVHVIFQARILALPEFPTPGDLPDPGVELESPVFPVLQANSLSLSHLIWF